MKKWGKIVKKNLNPKRGENNEKTGKNHLKIKINHENEKK